MNGVTIGQRVRSVTTMQDVTGRDCGRDDGTVAAHHDIRVDALIIRWDKGGWSSLGGVLWRPLFPGEDDT